MKSTTKGSTLFHLQLTKTVALVTSPAAWYMDQTTKTAIWLVPNPHGQQPTTSPFLTAPLQMPILSLSSRHRVCFPPPTPIGFTTKILTSDTHTTHTHPHNGLLNFLESMLSMPLPLTLPVDSPLSTTPPNIMFPLTKFLVLLSPVLFKNAQFYVLHPYISQTAHAHNRASCSRLFF